MIIFPSQERIQRQRHRCHFTKLANFKAKKASISVYIKIHPVTPPLILLSKEKKDKIIIATL